jgi:hypothetical protein
MNYADGHGYLAWDYALAVLSFIAGLFVLASIRAPEVFDSVPTRGGRWAVCAGCWIECARWTFLLATGDDPLIPPFSLIAWTFIFLGVILVNSSLLFLKRTGDRFVPVVPRKCG